MFTEIFLYEIKYWLKKPSIYIYFFTFFSIALLAMVGTGGLFDPHTSGNKTQRFINSPHEINYIVQYFNKFFLFLLPAIIGATIYKDFKYNAHTVIYSFPIQKMDYLLGKFLSSLIITSGIATSFSLGIMIGEHIPGLDPYKVGDFNATGYLQAYFVYTLPNLIIYGGVVFSVVALFRNIYAGFVTVILLLCLQSITQNAFGSNLLIALSDPFGQNSAKYVTQFWTLEERNTLTIPILGVVLYNRLIWLGIGVLSFLFLAVRFKFEQNTVSSFLEKIKMKKTSQRKVVSSESKKVEIPSISYNYSINHQLSVCWKQSIAHFKYIITNWMFLLLSLLGILSIVFLLAKVTNNGEMTLLPVTQLMLAVPAFFFIGIILLVTFIYSGMLIHRERLSNMNQLIDTTAIPNWVFMIGKLTAIIKVQAIMLLLMMMSGIALQIYNGYYHFEIGLYLFHLFVPTFIALIVWALVAMLIHTLFPNVYLGIFVLVIGWIGTGALSQIGIQSKLLLFNPPPSLQYSDLNGYGNQLVPYLYTELYWLAFGAILLVVTYLLWNRGLSSSLKDRFGLVKQRFSKQMAMGLAVLLSSFSFLAFDIHKKQMDDYGTSKKVMNSGFETFKKNFSQYEGMIQPKITSVKIGINLFPKTNSFNAVGEYILVNKSASVLDTLLIRTGFDEVTTFEFDKEVELIHEDKYMKFSVLKLTEPILVGDSLLMSFTIKNKPNTFYGRNSNVLNNGTFIGADICPRLGYNFANDSQAHPSDSISNLNNVLGADADFINFEAIVSTSENQLGIAAGYLVNEWAENGRKYFHYKLDKPIKFAFGFNSGIFQSKKVTENGVSLEVIHHPTHSQNVDKMLDGLKASLTYNTKHFGSYQHKEARIIEFPNSEGSYATTFANSIPTSEMRFIADARDGSDKADLPFYVAAHELTHQWWGAQLVPADAKGSRMLSESITEYITLNIYEEFYGKEKAMNFLRMQRNRYLKGRTSEQDEEPSLSLVDPEQQYISYGKGSVVFNALGKYLGEDKLNKILKTFLEEYKFKAAPYPTSLDLVDHLKSEIPDSLQYLVKDMFETVTFYNNKVIDAKSMKQENNEYEITVSFEVRKTRSGSDEDLYLSDYIEIGIYNENDEEIYIGKHKVSEKTNSLKIKLTETASKVIVDPNTLLIDRDLEDNEMEIK